MTALRLFLMKIVCYSSKYQKSYNFGKRTDSEKRKPVSDSVTQILLEKVNPVKKQFRVYQCNLKKNKLVLLMNETVQAYDVYFKMK